MKKFSLFMAALAALIFSCPAFSQSVPLQAGPWTSGHQPMYSLSGGSQPVVQDGGGAGGGAAGTNPSELGLTIRGTGTAPYANQGNGPLNTNLCDYDAPTNNSGGYHYLCLSPNAQGGGLISYGAGGTASQLPLYFNINGTNYEFPAALSGVAGPATSTVGDLACWNNTSGTLLEDCGSSVFTGPTSSTIDDIPTFNNTTGNKVKDSGVSLGSQAQSLFLGTPSNASGAPIFRSLVGADLPSPQSTAKGGVMSSAAPTNEFATGIDTSGNVTYAQPTLSNLGNIAADSVLGNATGSAAVPTALTTLPTGLTIPAANLGTPSAVTLTNGTGLPSSAALYTQQGTGAVSSNAQAKLNQFWVTPEDFGALHNGGNDAADIQLAINAIIANGGGTLYLLPGTQCYVANSTININLSAVSGRFNGAMQIVGGGPNGACITSTSIASPLISYTGSISHDESYFHVENVHLLGNSSSVVAGSVGIKLNTGAWMTFDRVYVEYFDYGVIANDVDQVGWYNSNIRFNNQGFDISASTGVTSANSWSFFNSLIAGNAVYGLYCKNCNGFSYFGGSVQGNGGTTGTVGHFGMEFEDAGDGYGTILFDGMAFEGNLGVADLVSIQNNDFGNYTFNNVAFERTASFGTYNISLNGTAASRYNLEGGTSFRSSSAYTPSGSRPNISIAGAQELVTNDGSTYFQNSAEQWSGYTIASLPTCGATLKNARTYVTNGQSSPGFLGAVSTTGTSYAPVGCNGSSWAYGF